MITLFLSDFRKGASYMSWWHHCHFSIEILEFLSLPNMNPSMQTDCLQQQATGLRREGTLWFISLIPKQDFTCINLQFQGPSSGNLECDSWYVSFNSFKAGKHSWQHDRTSTQCLQAPESRGQSFNKKKVITDETKTTSWRQRRTYQQQSHKPVQIRGSLHGNFHGTLNYIIILIYQLAKK